MKHRLSEEALIKILTKNLPKKSGAMKLGVGDDCSIIRQGNKDILISCDSLVENIHFKKSWGPWKIWGKKIAGAALSDIAAMGGEPKFAWINLSLPKNFSLAQTQKFYAGLLEVFRKYKTVIAGGNICASPKNFAAHITVWGEAPAGKALLRSKAKAGDTVYLSGILKKDSKKATPQIKLGVWLRKIGAHACIDVSDGLVTDLNQIAKASGVKIILEAEKIPHIGSLKEAITCGENYLLAFTLPAHTKIKNPPCKITPIGKVGKGRPGVEVLDKKGRLLKFPKIGYDHLLV